RQSSGGEPRQLHGAVRGRGFRRVEARQLVRGDSIVGSQGQRLLIPFTRLAVAAGRLQDQSDRRARFGGLRRMRGQRFERRARVVKIAAGGVDLREQCVSVERCRVVRDRVLQMLFGGGLVVDRKRDARRQQQRLDRCRRPLQRLRGFGARRRQIAIVVV